MILGSQPPLLPTAPADTCRVSIIIKALNEEKRIAAAITSALAAVERVGGEVILADSCSTDRTIEIASRFPIRIVQLANPRERCCGIGPQLGYQHAKGEFVYILDGDMELDAAFLPQAIAFLERHPEVGGAGGRLIELNTTSLEYIARQERAAGHMQPGEVDRLDGGGLYRRQAIEASGYFSNRNLHSYEEFDLAIRLRAGGWQLWRLDIPSVSHYGHDTPPYQLLRRRWKNGYTSGLGELLRAAVAKPHFLLALRGLRELRLYLGVIAWWLSLIALVAVPAHLSLKLPTVAIVALFPLLTMAARKRSLGKAIYSLASWCINASGLIKGACRRQISPLAPIEALVLK